MIILGIDPGLATLGYGIVEKINNNYKLIDYGTITTGSKQLFSKRLCFLSEKLKEIISTFKPDTIAVEELFFNSNTKTALAVAQARGVIMLTAEQCKKETFSYTPLQIKIAITGYGFADKKQIQFMTKKLLNLQISPKPDDAADALALAICHGHSYKLKSLK